jgi:hypothetical protein
MSDLRGNATPGEVKFGITGKIIGAVIVLIIAAAIGVYVHQTSPQRPNQVVSMNDLPSPILPKPAPARPLPPNTPAQPAPQQ